METLTHGEARAFYDRFGGMQDWPRFGEDRAVDAMLARADLGAARAVVEFGCGTGRLAEIVLERHASPRATYDGFDVSRTMVALARSRLARFPGRSRVSLTDGSPRLPLADASADRYLSTYVIDLLSIEDARAAVGDAWRLLTAGGVLCLVSLTHGHTWASRRLEGAWRLVHRIRPQLTGGCRPVCLMDLVARPWEIAYRGIVCRFGLCSEVLIAEKGAAVRRGDPPLPGVARGS
jgi:ubiquinone/menaquinone biosynthesis C-methylase UbiE